MEIALTEAKAKFSALIEKAINGEETIVTKMGKPVAKVVPYNEAESKLPLLGLMEGKIWIGDDFDEWPEDMARALGIIE